MGLFDLFKKKYVTKEKTDIKAKAPSVEKSNCSEPIAIPDIKGEFGGEIIKVLKENYQVFGFEKSFEKKSILRKGSQYYYQTIEKVVASENNGRPNTYYNEYVYQINASNIDAISLENIWDYIVSDCVFDKCTAEPGVWF